MVPPLSDSCHLTTISPSIEMAMSEEVVWEWLIPVPDAATEPLVSENLQTPLWYAR